MLGAQPENCAMCGQCACYYLIEADGNVYPCDFYALDAYNMGNIRHDSFFKLEKSPVGEAFRETSRHVSKECQRCPWYALCRGGCRRDREPLTNGRPQLNRWCPSYRHLFEQCFPQMQIMARKIAAR